MPPLRYALDHLAVRNGRLLAWGWILSAGLPVHALALRIDSAGGRTRRFTATLGTARPDIASAFPDDPRAATAGFVVTGFVDASDMVRATLEVQAGDEREDFDITARLRGERASMAHDAMRALRAAWRRIRAGEWRALFQRLGQRHRASRPANAAWIERHWSPLLQRPACLVFDHDVGGGANQFRERLVAERLAAGQPVVLFTYRLSEHTHEARLLRPGSDPEIRAIDRFESLEPLLRAGRVAEAVVNSPVTFDDPAGLARWLAEWRPRAGFRLVVMIHDFFAVCRSFVLVDTSGRHCGVPDLAACERCMATNDASIMNLSPPTPIVEWRAAWSRALHAADEIRCFSRSSRDLLLRAHPDLPRERITVVPHDTGHIALRPAKSDPSAPLVIGVIGQVNPSKGAYVVAEVARLAEKAPGGARVVVIGTLEPPLEAPRLTVTGRYRREDLTALVERHGVNMLFFPSVWPETFSYVVAEMMALGLPIVAFDLGAPAERLAHWPLARLSPRLDAAAAFDALLAYHRERAAQAA